MCRLSTIVSFQSGPQATWGPWEVYCRRNQSQAGLQETGGTSAGLSPPQWSGRDRRAGAPGIPQSWGRASNRWQAQSSADAKPSRAERRCRGRCSGPPPASGNLRGLGPTEGARVLTARPAVRRPTAGEPPGTTATESTPWGWGDSLNTTPEGRAAPAGPAAGLPSAAGCSKTCKMAHGGRGRTSGTAAGPEAGGLQK